MFRHRSKRVGVVIVLIGLIMDMWLHLSSHASVIYACTNCESITSTPTAILTLNGTNQIVNYTLNFSVSNSGVGGWHVTITSTEFTTGGTRVHTLSAKTFAVTSVNAVCQSGQTCSALPQDGMKYPITVPMTSTPVTFYDAQASSGIGTFDVAAAMALTIPGNAYSGIYTSTFTLALANGP